MSEGLVLVVDDEAHIRELVRLYLEKEGFKIAAAADGEEGLRKARTLSPQLIILDIMLPKLDGWDVCREVRKTARTPIIMLTAKGEEFDRILGLELGADDYLTKPFSPRELVARVKAVLRRAAPDKPATDGGKIMLPGLLIDLPAREVRVAGQLVSLTPKEFDLILFLARHPGKVFTREQLFAAVWGYDYYGDLRTVDTHIKRLREKVEKDGTAACHVRTIWGVGYKFEVLDK